MSTGVVVWSGVVDCLLAGVWFVSCATKQLVYPPLPLLKRGYCEDVMTIEEVEERADSVRVGASFKDIDDETREAVSQYGKDLAYLKDLLKRATE